MKKVETVYSCDICKGNSNVISEQNIPKLITKDKNINVFIRPVVAINCITKDTNICNHCLRELLKKYYGLIEDTGPYNVNLGE